MNSIILKQKELAELRDTGEVWVLRPLKKQPPEYADFVRVEDEEKESFAVFKWFRGYPCIVNCQARQYIPLKYPVGRIMGVRSSDEKIKVISNQVKRVQDIDIIDIGNLELDFKDSYSPKGIYEDKSSLINWFNQQYAKPRKWKDGYVSYEYSEGDYWNWYDSNYHRRPYPVVKPMWKGKPLTIHCNPYCEIARLKLED